MFENTDKKCPACGGEMRMVRFETTNQYLCGDCKTVVYVPVNEDIIDSKTLLKG